MLQRWRQINRAPGHAGDLEQATCVACSDADALALIYELLDALDDTRRMVEGLPIDDELAGHVRYIRDLQRAGREVIAHADAGVAR
jgi:hypothetical protein